MFVPSKQREGIRFLNSSITPKLPNQMTTQTSFASGQTPEVGHKRSVSIILQEGGARHQECSGAESLQRCTRKQRAEEPCCVVACAACCGHQNIPTIQHPGRSAVAIFEPAAWKETPAELSEWIAMFNFLTE